MARIKPDKPTYTVHASDFDSMDPELREKLEVFFTEQEKRKAVEKEEAECAYQAEQAEVVLAQPGWSEIKADWLESARMDLAGNSDYEFCLDSAVRTFVYDEDGNEYNMLHLPDDRPTIHQFYEDLYGIEYTSWEWWPGKEPPVPILVNHRDREHPYQVYEDYGAFIKAVQKETSFIYLGRFWEPTRKDGLKFSVAKKNAMTHINGVCIDIDRVEDDRGQHYGAKWVMDSLFEFLDGRPDLMPNYLMLSGTGIQLWYVFGQSIPLLSKHAQRRAKYDRFIKHLYAYFAERLPRNRFKVDTACGAYNHAFRAPGSPSKLGYPARLFVLGGVNRKMIDPIELSNSIGDKLEPYDVGEWDQEYFESMRGAGDGREQPASEKQLAYIGKLHDMGCVEDEVLDAAGDMTVAKADATIKHAEGLFTRILHYRQTGGYAETSNGRRIRLSPRPRGLYDVTLRRIHDETKPGSRYMSMFVLAGIAYNCNVSKSALEHDLVSLMDSEWGRKPSPTDGKPITSKDVRSALLGYNPIGCLRPKEMIEDVVGWSYGPPAKRNGRNRHDHLWGDWYVEDDDGAFKPVINTARENRRLASSKSRACAAKSRRESSIDRLCRYLTKNPLASKRSACKELSMSFSTVTKYWAEACAAAGVADVRTGNHRPF